jgi:hypothetical protein
METFGLEAVNFSPKITHRPVYSLWATQGATVYPRVNNSMLVTSASDGGSFSFFFPFHL